MLLAFADEGGIIAGFGLVAFDAARDAVRDEAKPGKRMHNKV
jgi:hypothetical protein